jgi:uncharacterized protein YjeT (DUF2065 family)
VADTFWAALALVLVVEGLMPLLAPQVWRDTFRRLIEMSDGQIRASSGSRRSRSD